MKAVMICVATLLAGSASILNATEFSGTNLQDISMSELMATCSGAEAGSAAQLQCFAVLSDRIKQQEEGQTASTDGASPIEQSLEALRAVAEYEDAESGLKIEGNGCLIRILYYGNYYRISRRNVSTLDLFNAQFNASKLQYDQTTQLQTPSLTWVKGVLEPGSTAASKGGQGLDSTVLNFEPKSANTSIGDYANAVVSQLPSQEGQTFEFVLVHPKRAQATNEIFGAFASFVKACKG